MYDLTEEEKAIYDKMENRKKAVKAVRRSLHKCGSCVWAHWVHDEKLLCTYSPVNCVKDGE